MDMIIILLIWIFLLSLITLTCLLIIYILSKFTKSVDRCPCGGEYQQYDKYYDETGGKHFIDTCKKCGDVKER